MVNKRKRVESNDIESDEVTPGKQTLPVANLPHDFDQEPQDGMQYLFLVRRDARRLPHVTRVHNPYEVSEPKVTRSFTPQLSSNDMPREKWRVVFQTHFSNLRKNLSQAAIHVDNSSLTRRVIPEKKDRDAWWNFLAGHPESIWATKNVRKKLGCKQAPAESAGGILPGGTADLPGTQLQAESSFGVLPQTSPQPDSLDYRWSLETTITPFAVDTASSSSKKVQEERLFPPEITPSHLQEIDHLMSVHLLMYFTHWINVHLQNPGDPLKAISVNHGRWMFALLARVEDHLSADEMDLLRNLARACLALIQRHRSEHAKNDAVSGVSGSLSTEPISDASCWMVIAAVAGHWGQRDLWADADAKLASDRPQPTAKV